MRVLFVWMCLSSAACIPQSLVDDAKDRDGDGFQAWQVGGDDCDDSDPRVAPDAAEVCGDGIDNDCDGQVDDEGLDALTWYADDDGDGYGDGSTARESCSGIDGHVTVAGDCDDRDDQVYPGADELCDGVINDCRTAELPGDEVDNDGDGYVECTIGLRGWQGADGVVGGDDCDDTLAAVHPDAPEQCDGVVNDCSGGVLGIVEIDNDGDGYVDCEITGAWHGAAGIVGGGDCVDDPSGEGGIPGDQIHPGATELCADGVDNDCDNGVDDDGVDVRTWYPDGDGDGFGTDSGAVTSCSVLATYALAGGDCDDGDASVHPGADEIFDGQLNDCEQSAIPPTEIDDDGDDHVECAIDPSGWNGPVDIVAGDDCDDTEGHVYPGAPARCDGLVNDCDATSPLSADEVDGDGDGYVDCTLDGAWLGAAGVLGGGDCVDDPAGLEGIPGDAIHPGMPETCDNGVDDDCDPDPTQCRWSGVVDVSEADFVYEGAVELESLGRALAASDVDGDGVSDLLIGSGYYRPQQLGGDPELVIPGTIDAWLGGADAPFTGLWSVEQQYGVARLGADDVDGDGVAEVVFLSAKSQPRGVAHYQGPVQPSVDEVTGAVLFEFPVVQTTWSHWGYLNDDDHPDAVTINGSMFVSMGLLADDVQLSRSVQPNDRDYAVSDAVEGEGSVLLYDADDDDKHEIVVGSPGADSGAGAIYFLELETLPGSLDGYGRWFDAPLSFQGTGMQLLLDDLDGDAVDDLVARSRHRILAFLGPLDPTSTSVRASTVIDAGADDLATGDADADGKADLASLRVDQTVDVHLYWSEDVVGGAPPSVRFELGSWVIPPVTEHIGRPQVVLGDFNGDGAADLAVGRPNEEVDGVSQAGRVYVFLAPRQ